MLAPLLLLLCLSEQIWAQNPPDVDCLIVNHEQVHCVWNKKGTPEVNYTFSSWFERTNDIENNCTDYLKENNVNIGCKRHCNRGDKFMTFVTVLRHGNEEYEKKHELKKKVKLDPPTNVTVKIGSDFNLWFYWNQSVPRCVDNQVRYRINNKTWEYTHVPSERLSYCINLPSSNSRYELQVRSKITESCGDSDFWSDWSDPVAWGFNNSTNTNIINEPISVWTPVLYVVGAITLILLVIMLLRHERLRIILIPVVPKPLLSSPEIEDWFPFSKGLMKEGFKANYNEQACPVREYIYVSRSDSNTSNTSDLTVTTDQTDCSVSIVMYEPEEPSTPFASSSDSSEEDQKVSV
uniref:Interleukin 2 receptor, gamma a n=1 Tax=Iconisemion striatum TaxID=60296 RepID=A0A1A7WN07_9TELE